MEQDEYTFVEEKKSHDMPDGVPHESAEVDVWQNRDLLVATIHLPNGQPILEALLQAGFLHRQLTKAEWDAESDAD